mmetsp:Transcript_35851/g.82298  ORF Transcript_35851/g.82298 Transcript_35851/m.82298 type:complete len:375 (-) Transcript_35851:560-1684(-)
MFASLEGDKLSMKSSSTSVVRPCRLTVSAAQARSVCRPMASSNMRCNIPMFFSPETSARPDASRTCGCSLSSVRPGAKLNLRFSTNCIRIFVNSSEEKSGKSIVRKPGSFNGSGSCASFGHARMRQTACGHTGCADSPLHFFAMLSNCFATYSEASRPSESRDRSLSWNKCTSLTKSAPPVAAFQTFAISFSTSEALPMRLLRSTSISWPVVTTSISRRRCASNFATVLMPLPRLPRKQKCKGLPPRTPCPSRFFCTSTSCFTFVSICLGPPCPIKPLNADCRSRELSGACTAGKLSCSSGAPFSTSSLGKKMPKPAGHRKSRSPFGAFPSQSDFDRFSSSFIPMSSLLEKEGTPKYITVPSRPLSFIFTRSPT